MSFVKENESGIKKIYSEYCRFCELLTYEEVLIDKKLFLSIEKKKRMIEGVARFYESYLSELSLLSEYEELLDLSDESEKEEIYAECELIKDKIADIERVLRIEYSAIDADICDFTIEINANKDQPSCELLAQIRDGYLSYFEKNGFSHSEEGDEYKRTLFVSGIALREHFKYEAGLHRQINGGGVCSVFVYESVKGLPPLDEADLEIECLRSSGAGGQHINTTDSAVRVTHKSSGLSVVSRNERSQFQNKDKAIALIREKYEKMCEENIKKLTVAAKSAQLTLVKNMHIAKQYDPRGEKITRADKTEISYKDFLLGRAL